METLLITILGAASATNLWLCSAPTRALRSLLRLDAKGTNWFGNTLVEMLNCAMCTGFWAGLASALFVGYTGLSVLLVASMASLAAEFINRKLNDSIKLDVHKWN